MLAQVLLRPKPAPSSVLAGALKGPACPAVVSWDQGSETSSSVCHGGLASPTRGAQGARGLGGGLPGGLGRAHPGQPRRLPRCWLRTQLRCCWCFPSG